MVIRCNGFFFLLHSTQTKCVCLYIWYTVADIRLLWFCCMFCKWFKNQYDSHILFRYNGVVKKSICSVKLPGRLCDYQLEMQCFDWVCRLFVWCWCSIMICFPYEEKCYFNERRKKKESSFLIHAFKEKRLIDRKKNSDSM